jgi:hypothetical protein
MSRERKVEKGGEGGDGDENRTERVEEGNAADDWPTMCKQSDRSQVPVSRRCTLADLTEATAHLRTVVSFKKRSAISPLICIDSLWYVINVKVKELKWREDERVSGGPVLTASLRLTTELLVWVSRFFQSKTSNNLADTIFAGRCTRDKAYEHHHKFITGWCREEKYSNTQTLKRTARDPH